MCLQDRLSVVNNAGVLHVVECICLSLSLVVKFSLGDLADDAPVDPRLSIFLFDLLFLFDRFEILLVQQYFNRYIFDLNKSLRVHKILLWGLFHIEWN